MYIRFRFNLGECIYLVSFWGYKKYKPYFIWGSRDRGLLELLRRRDEAAECTLCNVWFPKQCLRPFSSLFANERSKAVPLTACWMALTKGSASAIRAPGRGGRSHWLGGGVLRTQTKSRRKWQALSFGRRTCILAVRARPRFPVQVRTLAWRTAPPVLPAAC